MPKRPLPQEPLEVILVCCGEPKKSMGWFHLTQLLTRTDVLVSAVVEPWFLGKGCKAPGAEKFQELREANASIQFCATMDELKPRAADAAPRLVLIAGRTCDAPTLFAAALEKGATHIYVEKPGAESAVALMKMREQASSRGVAVVVGYNKNVAKYACDALAELEAAGGRGAVAAAPPLVALEHCNDFSPGDGLVEFLRGPGGEGMLHNMCCHELALAATRFGVTCERIERVSLVADRSELLDLGDGRWDWSRVAFKLDLKPAAGTAPAGQVAVEEITFLADRCGGNFSRLLVTLPAATTPGAAAEPAEPAEPDQRAFRLPDPELERWIAEEQARDPEIRPYFLQQAADYSKLKGAFVEHILAGESGIPDGVVGLDGAIEALRLADLLKPIIQKCWKTGGPWVAARQ